MSILTDLAGIAGIIGAPFTGGLSLAAGPLAGLLSGSGGSGGFDLSSLAPLLSGQLTSQRIPGQTTSGEYTPPAGGYGTYNYIPTGAPQLDPALISQIMASLGQNRAASDIGTAPNNQLLSQQLNNPLNDLLNIGANRAGGIASDVAGWDQIMASQLRDATGGLLLPGFENVINRAGSNPFMNDFTGGASQVGAGQVAAGGALSNQLLPFLSSALQNPFNNSALTGAQVAGNMLTGAGQNAYGQGATYSGTAAAGLPAAMSVLNTAFDPQTALYNRTATQLNDQLGAYLARTGLTNSGAGAKVASDALSNFNIDWQNNQLGRQTAGLNAFGQSLYPVGSALSTGNQLQSGGAGQVAAGAALPQQQYNTQASNAFNLAGQGAGAYGATSGLQYGGYQLPYQSYDQTTSDFGKYLGQFANALPGIGQGFNNVSSLGNAASNAAYGAGAIPYNAGQTIYGNQNTALGNYLGNAGSIGNLGNQNINQILSYLGAVNSGAGTAGNNARGAQTGQAGANAGAAAAVNPLITSGLSGLSNLLGSLFNSGAGPGGSSIFTTPGVYQW